uniref:Uncharacterized protein n=1 Tax=Pyxicephalus adspersus TaxID=30357 RepID=A0AAV2ZX54_PYXAD|nr:TPA: hypothetical protein GDO54_014092 [Pyxicephalus adspersus]
MAWNLCRTVCKDASITILSSHLYFVLCRDTSFGLYPKIPELSWTWSTAGSFHRVIKLQKCTGLLQMQLQGEKSVHNMKVTIKSPSIN